jgi:hypothetical protein
MALAVLTSSTACARRTYLLGAARLDAAVQTPTNSSHEGGQPRAHDAGPDQGDARTPDLPAADAGELRLAFRVRGRTGVTEVTTPCATDCFDAEVVIEGGTPPYHVLWSDGVTTSARTLCSDMAVDGDSMVTVSDRYAADGGVVGESLILSTVALCGDAGSIFDAAWMVCFAPQPVVPACAAGQTSPALVYDLRSTMAADTPFSLTLSLSSLGLSAPTIQFDASEDGCSSVGTVYSAGVWALSPNVSFSTTVGVPFRYLIVSSTDGWGPDPGAIMLNMCDLS